MIVENIQEGYFKKEEQMIAKLMNMLNQLETNLRKVNIS